MAYARLPAVVAFLCSQRHHLLPRLQGAGRRSSLRGFPQ